MEKKVIINIGRQKGAGGCEIGRMLASDFHATFYDKELLNLAAKESGFSAEFFRRNDEKKRFFRSFLQVPFANSSSSNFYQNNFSQEGLFKFQSDAIRKAAQQGSCVFMGRCADYVLRDFENVVNIFIAASLDSRIARIAEKRKLTNDEAKKLIEREERARAEYYGYYTGKQWGSAASYDLCIDSSILGLEKTERLIADFVKEKINV